MGHTVTTEAKLSRRVVVEAWNDSPDVGLIAKGIARVCIVPDICVCFARFGDECCVNEKGEVGGPIIKRLIDSFNSFNLQGHQ